MFSPHAAAAPLPLLLPHRAEPTTKAKEDYDEKVGSPRASKRCRGNYTADRRESEGRERGGVGMCVRCEIDRGREGWRAEEARRGKLSGQRGDQGAVANTIILQRYLADSHCSTILYLDHFWKREKSFDGAGLPYESALTMCFLYMSQRTTTMPTFYVSKGRTDTDVAPRAA